MRVMIVTPEETMLDAWAEFVAMPLFDGEIGIYRNHSPMIGRLGYGEMRIRSGSKTSRFYIDGGFVQVAENEVSVMTNRSLPSEEVDGLAASEQLDSALKAKAAGDEQIVTRGRQADQARAQLRIARRTE